MASSSIGKKPQVAPYSGDIFPSVARSAMVKPARPGPKYSTNLPTTPRLQHLRHGENQIGRGDTLFELAVEPNPDHFRQQHRIGLAEHRRLGLDAADTPAEHREPVDHRGV